MTGTVPMMSIVFMAISCFAGFAIPIFLFFFFWKKKKADILPFFVGCFVMVIFAFILEAVAHQLILGSSAGKRIQGSIWLYALYGGLMAGLFEETGRLIAFKTVLRRKNGKDINALMYGAGHGGIEVAVILGFSMISNLALAVTMNQGAISEVTGSLSGDALLHMEAALETLSKTPSYLFLIGLLERIFAVGIHLSLSVLVWFAAKNRHLFYLYPVAILLHLFVDAAAVILSQYQVPPLAIEAVVGVMTVLAVGLAKRTWIVNAKGGEG